MSTFFGPATALEDGSRRFLWFWELLIVEGWLEVLLGGEGWCRRGRPRDLGRPDMGGERKNIVSKNYTKLLTTAAYQTSIGTPS